MSWRIVEISSGAKLDLQLGYLVIRGEQKKKIHISEIAILIIENTAVSLTSALLCELTKQKVRVIFCDEKRNPQTELIPYYGSHDTSLKVQKQALWSDELKKHVWASIISNKLRKQSQLLNETNHIREATMIESYIKDIQPGDETNREGHAAKVYFNALFGLAFTRTLDTPINSALNYGYSLMLSAVAREISAYGCITQIGIHHRNMYNDLNLASDLMEPFRILVDRKVYELQPKELSKEIKLEIVHLLNETVICNGYKQTTLNAIRIYVKSVLDALNTGDTSIIQFYSYEL